MHTLKLFFRSLFILALVVTTIPVIPPKHVSADSGTVFITTNNDSHSGCWATIRVDITSDGGGFRPGGPVTVSFTDSSFDRADNGADCGTMISTGPGWVREWGAGFDPNSTNPVSPLSTITIPSSPNAGKDYVLYLYASIPFDSLDSTGGHRTAGSSSFTLIRGATVTVNACPQGGTWTLDGKSTSPVYVAPSSAGTMYTLNYNPPAGYAAVITPASSQLMFQDGTYSFTATCSPNTGPNVDFSGRSVGGACGEVIDVNWNSDGLSCSSLDIPALNPTGPASGNTTLYLSTPSSPTAIALHISCTGATGVTSTSTRVQYGYDSSGTPCGGTTGNKVTVNLNANPSTISPGGSTTLTWGSTGTACSAWWTSQTGPSGSQVINNIVATTNYSMTCTNGPDSGSGSTLVVVTAGGSTSLVVNSNVPSTWSISPGGFVNNTPSTQKTYAISSCNTYTISPATLSGYTLTTSTHNTNIAPPASQDNNPSATSVYLCPSDTYSAVFTLNYAASSGTFDYSMSKPNDISVQANSSGQTSAVLTKLSGTTQQVTVSSSGMPSGVSAPFTSCSPTCTSTGTIQVNGNVAPGTYPITVTASSAGVADKTSSFNLTVTPGAFSGGGNTTADHNPAKTGTPVTFTACSASGGTPPYRYTWSSLETTPVFSPTSTGTSNTFTYTFNSVGTHPVTVEVKDANGTTVTCNPLNEKVVLDAQFQEF